MQNEVYAIQKYGTDQSHHTGERQKAVTANWYNTKCLSEILKELNVMESCLIMIMHLLE